MSGVRLTGEPVTVSGVADLAVGHGRFRLENPGPSPVRAAVEAAFLAMGDDRRELTPATVFDVDRDVAHEPGGFEVAPGAFTFMLGFPAVPDARGPGEEAAVVLRLSVDGATLEASSPVRLERRIPRR